MSLCYFFKVYASNICVKLDLLGFFPCYIVKCHGTNGHRIINSAMYVFIIVYLEHHRILSKLIGLATTENVPDVRSAKIHINLQIPAI